jgi:hypothetical protein
MKKLGNLFPNHSTIVPVSGNRRDFIRQSMLATAGFLTTGSGLLSCKHKQAKAGNPVTDRSGTIVTRRNIAAMAPDDQNVLMFREAVRVMKKRSDVNQLDPTGWLMAGTVHSLYCATSNLATQVHYNWLFFPWHRAFLSFQEKQMQAAINEPTFALPIGIGPRPPMPCSLFRQRQPAYDVTRDSLVEDEIPADFINVGPAMRAPKFSSFGGFDKSDPGVPQVEGIAEQSFHNNIHNWIGGNMGAFPTASLDPMFSGHHGNLDRMWAAWMAEDPSHKNPPTSCGSTMNLAFTTPRGKLTRIAVKDTLDTESLGYRFDTLDLPRPPRRKCPKART